MVGSSPTQTRGAFVSLHESLFAYFSCEYSWPTLVVEKMEELFPQPFLGQNHFLLLF